METTREILPEQESEPQKIDWKALKRQIDRETGYVKGVRCLWVKFQNLETQGAFFDFTIGPKTLASIPEGKAFRLEPGRNEYYLPLDVIEHLHSLATPEFAWVYSPEMMQNKTELVGMRNRVSLIPSRLDRMPMTEDEKETLLEETRMAAEAKAREEFNQKLEVMTKEVEDRLRRELEAEATGNVRRKPGPKPKGKDEEDL
jgi:hypothetical protein